MKALWTRMAATLLVAASLASVGCVSQGRADKMQTLYRRSQEQILSLQSQLEEKDSQLAAMRNAGPGPNTSQQLKQLKSERDQLQQALHAAEAQLRQAGQQQVVLPPQLDNALRQLAQQYPKMMTYEPKKGMVKFSSDLTFALGSAELNGQARQTLDRLANVLQSQAAQAYEIRIVGHTDNVPIRNRMTKARHPTNWYLSVHRAIAVENELQQAGVAPQRMGVAGYGQYRPIVPNGPHGAKANRRVEIDLMQVPEGTMKPVPTASGGPAGASKGQPQSGDNGGEASPPLNKSGIGTNNGNANNGKQGNGDQSNASPSSGESNQTEAAPEQPARPDVFK